MEIETKSIEPETINPENYTDEERDESYHGIYGDAIKIQKVRLISLLRCQICCGIYRNPTTINECMHTFCKSCIYKYFNEKTTVIRDSCPICGIKLGGRPLDTLIPNHSLSLLVDIIFPEFEQIDKNNTAKMYEAFRKNNEKLPGDEEEIMNKPTITLHLFPFDTEDPKYALPFTDVPVIVVQESMSIETLRKYIAQKLNMNENELMILYNNQEMILTNTMGIIKTLYGFNDEKIVFYYAKRPSQDDK